MKMELLKNHQPFSCLTSYCILIKVFCVVKSLECPVIFLNDNGADIGTQVVPFLSLVSIDFVCFPEMFNILRKPLRKIGMRH
jgi:hypothetical protein